MTFNINLPDEAATLALGAALAPGIGPGRVLHLVGELGAGKTTVARGLLHALGFPGRVKSPSYALVEPYTISSLHLYHFDFYRLKDPSEWLNSGFRDYFGPDSACLVEWPERAGDLPGSPDLVLTLEPMGEGRRATLDPRTEPGKAWLASVQSRLSCSD